MDLRETNRINDLCHGCLSFGRRCSMDCENVSLFYQLLDPFNILKDPSNLLLCWECKATLKKIRLFQLKANKAQAHLQDVIAHTIEHKSLSTLVITTKNIYDHTFNSEPDTQPSSSQIEASSRETELKSANCIIQKVKRKVRNRELNHQDLKRNFSNNKIVVETQEPQTNLVNNFRNDIDNNQTDEKFTITKVENSSTNELNLKDLRVIITKSEQLEQSVAIKEELEDYYSDGYLDDDHITLDVTGKEIKSEQLLTTPHFSSVHKKRKRTRIQRDRAKKTQIDYNNLDVYFTKLVLTAEAYKAQLHEWAKVKRFKANKYKCVECAMAFRCRSEEKSHQELHNNTTDHKCSLCSLSYSSEGELLAHGAAHDLYQCNICTFVCRTPNGREIHLREEHPRGYWKCDECTLIFRIQQELTAHKENLHRIFICDYCDTKRNTKLSIEKHITARHMPLKHQCHLCERNFRRRYNLKQHLIDAHNVPGLCNASKESTYCVECDRQYSSMARFRKHLQSSVVHTPRKKILVPCPVCGKQFTKKVYLNNHYKLFHGGGTKHRCDPCNKCYSSAYGLRMHLLRYHKKVPMPKTKVCETCGLGFQTNRILKHHMRTHTGERPHECSYCPARFAQKYARNVHVRNVHLKHLQHFIT